MENSLQSLEDEKNRAKQNFIGTFVKISETFILVVSIVMIFLSTIPRDERAVYYFIAVILFLSVAVLSLLVIFLVKNFHRKIGIAAGGGARDIKRAYQRYVEKKIDRESYKTELKAILNKRRGESGQAGNFRKTADVLLGFSLFLLLMGLCLLVFML